jgi:hypothetical protein
MLIQELACPRQEANLDIRDPTLVDVAQLSYLFGGKSMYWTRAGRLIFEKWTVQKGELAIR